MAITDLVNGLFKYALFEATIGEWEALIFALYYINNSNGGIIHMPKEKLVDILCYPFAPEIVATVSDFIKEL